MPHLKISKKWLVEKNLNYSMLSTKDFVERLGLEYTKVTDIIHSKDSAYLIIFYEEQEGDQID